MSAQKLSGEGKLRWTEEHRRALHLLKTEFLFDAEQEVAIFSQVFNVDGITKGKLCSQYWEMTREGKEHQWTFSEDNSPAERRCRQLIKERIYQASAELDLEEFDEGRLQRLSLSTPSKRKKRSRSSPPFGAPSGHETKDTLVSGSKRKRSSNPGAGSGSRTDEKMIIVRDDQDVSEISPTLIETPKPLNTPRTLRRKSSARTLSATVVYNRPLGSVNLTPEEFERTKTDLEWPETQARRPRLVFRYSLPDVDDREPSTFDKTGHFVARRYRATFGILNPGLPPTKEHNGSFWTDLFHHLNGRKQDTPFVSVSNSLAWTLRQAIQKSRSIGKDVKISLIEIEDSMSLYYAAQFQPELCKKYIFTNGAWKYAGTNEWLIFGSCKPFCTIAVSELLQFATTHGAVDQALRLDILAGPGSYHRDILPALKRQRIDFSNDLSRVFAQIASDLFRLTHETSVNVHQELVTSLCEGWSIVPREPKDEAEWADMAAEFEHALTRKSNVAVDVTTKELLKSAFYNGVKHALADRMAAHKTSRLLQIQKRAKNVGLASPLQMQSAELQSSMEAIHAYQAAQDLAIQSGGGQTSLLVGAAADQLSDDEQIRYEKDDSDEDWFMLD